MPPSKQARARQERQKERLAAIHARREVKRRRRKRLVAALVVVIIVSIVGLLFAFGSSGGGGTPSAAKSSNKCVKFNDTLPAGAPEVPIQPGPKPTKLVIQDLKVGTGAEARASSTISANYIGVACSTGKIFDSSYKSAQPQPIDTPLSGVIKGWQQGIPGMKVGGRRFLAIPADLAYGANPPAGIDANEPLFFVVDLTAVK